jgi:hypothetical protein
MDNSEKAKVIKFLFYFEKDLINQKSLRTQSLLGLIILIINELAFHVIIFEKHRIQDVSYIHSIIFSLARLAVFTYCYNAIQKNNIESCIKGSKAMNVVTIIYLVYLTATTIGCFAGMYLYVDLIYPPSMFIIYDIIAFAFNIYYPYVYVSFVKHLVIGVIQPINNSSYDGFFNSFMGIRHLALTNFTAVENTNNAGQYISPHVHEDKIIPNDAGDIVFAQSAQNAVVNGICLPSGLKVPEAPEGKE